MDNKQYIKSLKALKVKLEESKNKNFKDATKRLNNDLLINQYKKKFVIWFLKIYLVMRIN